MVHELLVEFTEGTEATDLKNGATEKTKETEKKSLVFTRLPRASGALGVRPQRFATLAITGGHEERKEHYFSFPFPSFSPLLRF
jgi:hypothetical protein